CEMTLVRVMFRGDKGIEPEVCAGAMSGPKSVSEPNATVFFSVMPPLPTSTLFPYTTLFRSLRRRQPSADIGPGRAVGRLDHGKRSEEHTSELQSRENLVCRLLLEKKNLVGDALNTLTQSEQTIIQGLGFQYCTLSDGSTNTR